jgi:putative SOS response-associated peptidase YedK
VPADAFYEWTANGKAKQPYGIAMRDRHPFAFAGPWENWKDPTTNEWVRTFTILTTKPKEIVAPLHDRMPVILAPGDYDRWLATEFDPGVTITMSYPSTAEGERAFKALSEGGNVIMPFQPTFWAKSAGMLTDKFGVAWNVNGEVII